MASRYTGVSHRGEEKKKGSKLGGKRRKDNFWPWLAVGIAIVIAVTGILLVILANAGGWWQGGQW